MGLVLVFDLDETVIDTKFWVNDPDIKKIFSQGGFLSPDETNILKKKIYDNLNKKVAEIILRAANLRPHTRFLPQWARNEKVSAICLLTNNSDKRYTALIDEVFQNISGLYGSGGKYENFKRSGLFRRPYFFDYIMIRNHPNRPKNTDNPPKRLEDVNRMLESLKIKFDISNLNNNSNLFFFDDRVPKHVIQSQIPDANYIQINPPFDINNNASDDKTDYSAILDRLDSIDHKGKEFRGMPPFCTERNCFGRPKGGSRRIKNGFKKRRRTVKSSVLNFGTSRYPPLKRRFAYPG